MAAKVVAPIVAVCALIGVLLVAAPWHVESAEIASEGTHSLHALSYLSSPFLAVFCSDMQLLHFPATILPKEGEEGRKRFHSGHSRHSPANYHRKEGRTQELDRPCHPHPCRARACYERKEGRKEGRQLRRWRWRVRARGGEQGGPEDPVSAHDGHERSAEGGGHATYYTSLTATVQALTNAGILIDEGQRTIVQGQIANAVSTIERLRYARPR
ncbi:unnamed protein product [Closterium sp. Naga37s-1]|nr:unnamed protein product [Closterium sp. Naga37s-1]